MYINNHITTKNLSNFLKNNPSYFDVCISQLVDSFIHNLNLNIDQEDILKLQIVYKFIFMYGLIISNFKTIPSIMNRAAAITNIVNVLIINSTLKLKQHLDLVNTMIVFGNMHQAILCSHTTAIRCCLHFRTNAFYKSIKQVVEAIAKNDVFIQ